LVKTRSTVLSVFLINLLSPRGLPELFRLKFLPFLVSDKRLIVVFSNDYGSQKVYILRPGNKYVFKKERDLRDGPSFGSVASLQIGTVGDNEISFTSGWLYPARSKRYSNMALEL